MRLTERIFGVLGYEPKSSRISPGVMRGWPKGMVAASAQDLPSDVAAYRYTLWTHICVKAISQDVASLPLKFYRGQGKNKKEIPDHFIAKLFDSINPNLSPYEFWLKMVGFYLLAGQCFAGIEKNNGNRPAELYPLMAHRVEIIPDAENFISGIKYRMNAGSVVEYARDELIWIKSFNPDNEYYGLSTVEPLHSTLTADMNSRAYETNFFKNDATPPGFLVSKIKLNSDTRERFIDAYEERHKGVENAHRMGVLEGEWSYLKTGDSPKDMQFERLRKMSREDILAAWGVPPGRVGINEYSNYANLEAQLKLYWASTIMPILKMILSQLNSNFIKRYDQDLWCAYDLSQVEALQENQEKKKTIATGLHDSGIFTANEIRADYYNKEPHPDGDILKNKAVIPGLDVSREKNLSTKSQDDRLEKWYAKDLSRRKQELGMIRVVKRYFDDQAERLLKRLNDFPQDYVAGPDDVEVIFDDAGEQEILKSLAGPLVKAAVKQSGQAGVDEVRSGKSLQRKQDEEPTISGTFDVNDPRIVAWLEKNAAKLVTDVTETTKEKIRRVLKEGQDNGWSISKIADELEDRLGELAGSRSVTIAQTEMGAAMNKGTIEGYRQSGVKVKKGWLATPDEKTRETHRAAGESEPIDLDSKFKVGNDYLDHPGDPSGSAEETVNCRCAILAIEITEGE